MPSKSRGLRTSTGCLVCRKRRVKCDETRPRCKNCTRVDRDCEYPQKSATPQRPRALSARTASIDDGSSTANGTSLPESEVLPLSLPTSGGLSSSEPAVTQSWIPFNLDPPQGAATVLPDDSFLIDDSLFSFGDTLTPSFGPIEWYDLLAQDAIDTMQDQNPSNRWNFDYSSLSRRETPRQSVAPEARPGDGVDPATATQALPSEPWNTELRIELKEEEQVFFEHYINVVAPILDLFDPLNHFASMVPHLALRNVGVLKSILAVGARHLTLGQANELPEPVLPIGPGTPASVHSLSPNAAKFAEQYYFETLQYLSQNLLYQTYTGSREILITAIMISTYEMFGTAENPDHSAWDRHLRGAFWIQRNSNISGESTDSFKRAVWFSWLRQDIWAAFRTGRPALTIHQPTKAMSDLTTEELTTRIIYITAKCVQFAATPKEHNITEYIEAGATLMRMLDAWKRCLPQSFEPIRVAGSYSTPRSNSDSITLAPIWIHPPAHAAAIQMYHFSRIVMVLNQPSTGGLNVYQTRFKMLRESTTMICGIASAQQSQNLPSAFVSFQAVYAAALCADSQEKQAEILEILDRALHISKFPSRSILNDLVKVWSGGS